MIRWHRTGYETVCNTCGDTIRFDEWMDRDDYEEEQHAYHECEDCIEAQAPAELDDDEPADTLRTGHLPRADAAGDDAPDPEH